MGFPSIIYGIILPRPLVELLDLWAQLKLMLRLALFYLGLFDPTDQSSSWNDHGYPTVYCLSQSSPPITPESIKRRLPIVEFTDFVERSGMDEHDETICAVCLSDLEMRHEIRELCNCTHVFHVGCLDKWVDQGQVTCPMCRSKLLPEKDENRKGGDWWLVERISFLFGDDLMRDGN
ncbi:brassinosteroid-responsive RING protein 1-like [Magnolia sinica]|uniref:brassinosteroid-responsive RING protein 1-like n=1 Tax=Magnolia sinica TaxID=86752 RepID=UPI0026598E46|nr:brassinosteroid-responsive RING protein 1-like [Magnolia sinica]